MKIKVQEVQKRYVIVSSLRSAILVDVQTDFVAAASLKHDVLILKNSKLTLWI